MGNRRKRWFRTLPPILATRLRTKSHSPSTVTAIRTGTQTATGTRTETVMAPTPPLRSKATSIASLTRAGLATIDAVLEVERHVQARGLRDFTFGADNIQKIWMSLFIDIRKNGGRS